ncbi:MAG: Glu/Leu/Phe/Val dehydrogenase [Myxococcales bacterium]|nr:Glu/Leu/Phe/Val dehydrogenase [Myxococcales bacterium]
MRPLEIAGYDEVHRLECGGAPTFLAIHTRFTGRAFGGIRSRDYPSERAALGDALALSQAMSRKAALAEIPGGGAKTVMMRPPPERRREALEELAAIIESLGGSYCCGGDYGFTVEDEATVRARTRHIATGDLSDATAAGVELAMLAAEIPTSVAIQGLGRVGEALARRLVARGIKVLAADPSPHAATPRGVRRVDPATILEAEVDVLAPCAHGGVLGEAAIERLRCRRICGAANNPFATKSDADRLHARGIAYVPDFVANAGALIEGALTTIGEAAAIEARMAALPELVRAIDRESRRRDRSPHWIAVEIADARLATRRRRSE